MGKLIALTTMATILSTTPERVRRLNPQPHTLRRLFAYSRNLCAFENCSCPVINQFGQLQAEVCHIEAANETGQRFNPAQTNEDRRQFENLILLCRNHHTETNDVVRYPTPVMRQMKASHEAKAHLGITPTAEAQQRFVDQSITSNLQLPSNFQQLDLTYLADSFFPDAYKIMNAVASLPQLTRSLYAHALAYGRVGDLSIYCDPMELSQRLNTTPQSLEQHFSILEHAGLMWFPEYDTEWRDSPTIGTRSYFRQFDRDDNGIWFLILVCNRFAQDKAVLVDIFESLNFQLLDT